MLSRFFKLLGGKFSRWIKAREARDPEAVYESAISDRVQRYHQLKTAAAGVIYMRNKLERELREKLAEEQRLMLLQRNFVSMASHEFRTPITVIDAHAQRLISMKGRLSPDDLRNIDKVFIVACGSSYHAALVAKYAIEHWVKLPTEVDIASEFRYRDPVLDGDVQVFVLDYDDLDAGSPPDNALNPYPITHVILPDVTTLLVKNLRDYQPGKGKGKHNGN